jgi:hypothetical protein
MVRADLTNGKPRGTLSGRQNPTGQGTSVKKLSNIRSRSLLWAMAGVLMVLMAAGNTSPATAQSSDAANLCTPDVMRLCNEFIPDADRIVGCLRAKRRQLSPGCLGALSSGGGGAQKARKRRVRHHRD